jgi:hypothetical protein
MRVECPCLLFLFLHSQPGALLSTSFVFPLSPPSPLSPLSSLSAKHVSSTQCCHNERTHPNRYSSPCSPDEHGAVDLDNSGDSLCSPDPASLLTPLLMFVLRKYVRGNV